MTLLRLFVVHEWRSQWRSMRFRVLATIYVLLTSFPAVSLFLIAGRTVRVIGPAAVNMFLLSEQPLLTALLAAGLAIDAISRERDEGSFSVLSVAPLSSSGYVLRRWLAVVAVCVPISLLPTILSAALSTHDLIMLPLLRMFLYGWLLSVLPAILASSALSVALGTITGRAVLSIIIVAVLFTIGLDTLNGLMFHVSHSRFSGPGDLFAGGERTIDELFWAIKGLWFPDVPSDAAFPLRARSRALLSHAGITTAMTFVLLALAAFYLRRTRRDLRPWNIAETHPLRTLLRMVNRIREEYALDGRPAAIDYVTLAAAVVVAALLTGAILREQSAFASLAASRYAAEMSHGVPTDTSVVAETMRVDGEIDPDGSLRSRISAVIRNRADHPESHLSFALNPNVSLQRITVNRGHVRTGRAWERLDVELDPPLAPGEARDVSFDLAGVPAEIHFELSSPGNFRAQWPRFRDAREAVYLSDLSRSTILTSASELRMRLEARDFMPVLRYSPWTLNPDGHGDGFLLETVLTTTALDCHLRHPYPIAVDSCGVLATNGTFSSRCAVSLPSYLLFGGPMTERPLGDAATLIYIPSHESLAQAHAPALAAAIRMAGDAWPHLSLASHIVFVERPTERGDRQWYNAFQPWRSVSDLGSRGAVFFVPEMLFTTRTPIEPNVFAASIISGSLRGKRRVVAEEADFFSRFFNAIAVNRLGLRKTRAVEPGAGVTPETAPLLSAFYRPESRMSKVLTAIEYRVGEHHFVEGINDFVSRGGERAGTAKELLDAIGRAGGVDLTQAYDDYFVGRALPQLTLDEVTFHRVGQRWEVSGIVRNAGTGEAFVPIALRTAQGSLFQTIRVVSGGRTPFAFTATGEPHALQLDPDRVCYRQAAIGLVENVEYRGES